MLQFQDGFVDGLIRNGDLAGHRGVDFLGFQPGLGGEQFEYFVFDRRWAEFQHRL